MNGLLDFIHQEDILCIADEVLTGFGRTGALFASEQLKPADIICLSKGLTGGTMALGVTAATENLFNAFLSEDRTMTFFHGHSYTANPLACTAGLASLDLLEDKKCRDRINAISIQHEQFVKNNLSKKNKHLFRNIRILGTLLAFEINAGKDEYLNDVGTTVMKQAMAKGIYLRPLGNTIYIMPPYCITDEELKKIYSFLSDMRLET